MGKIRSALRHTPVAAQADRWQEFHNGFVRLAEMQDRIARATRKDFLFADCNFAHPEFDSVPKGPFCLLPTLESAILELRMGPDEHLRAQCEALASRAGNELGCPADVPPLKFWLWNLLIHLQKTKSKHLWAPTQQVTVGDNPRSDLLKPQAGLDVYVPGGTITDVCLASAIFCSWLETEALKTPVFASSLAKIKPTDRERPVADLTEDSSHSEQHESTATDAASTQRKIDRAVASFKRRRELDDEPLPSGRLENLLSEIPRTDLDVMEREASKELVEAARLPRSVETEWQRVLSAKEAPDHYVDQGLAVVLTREYASAVSQAAGKFTSLLTTAAISHGMDVTGELREGLWRKCLAFTERLAQWGPFGTWAHRATGISWNPPNTPNGSPALDRLAELASRRRQVFDERIGMYMNEWITAADDAISLRLAVGPSPARWPDHETKNSNGKHRAAPAGLPEVAKRRALVRQHPSLEAGGLCEIFDGNKVPLPKRITEARTWAGAYKSSIYRPRIHTLISRDRTAHIK